MKKLIILTIVFIISVAIAMGLVMNEQRRRAAGPANTVNQSASVGGSASQVVPTNSVVHPPTVEGNIQLTVTYPQGNITTNESSLTIQGRTTPGASVMVNEYELKAGPDGTFSQTVNLDDGENYFSIVAYTDNGDVAEKELVVLRNVQGY